MGILIIVCSGWMDGDGKVHPCGLYLGQKEDPGRRGTEISHGLCGTCAVRQLEAEGLSPEVLDSDLSDCPSSKPVV